MSVQNEVGSLRPDLPIETAAGRAALGLPSTCTISGLKGNQLHKTRYNIPGLHIAAEKCLERYINHVGVPDIVQCDNCNDFKKAALILLKNYWVNVIIGRPRTPGTQGLVQQANGVMKDKLKKQIEATGNPHWTHRLLRVALAMKIQGHDSLP